ncbi:MAG: acetylxylan esterase [Planctomycetes bacterium]|nr:acetylxylan esterase [Planctomycetota bacterium]
MRNHAALLFLVLLGFSQEAPTYPPATEVRAAFLKQLDRPKVPADPSPVDTKTEGGFVTEHFSIATEKKPSGQMERMPVLLVRPGKADGKLPAVVVMHGTGGNKEGQRNWCLDLAKRGIIGIAIDARYHGERAEGLKGSARYIQAITEAWRDKPAPREHPFYYDTVWDLWRLADYLETRPDVDAKRLGMIGFSMGGIQTWLAASIDERWKVAVPAIGVQSFKWSLENEKWQGRANSIKGAHDAAAKDLGEAAVNQRVCRELWSKVIPGILEQFDCPSLLRLFAGRALLIPNGDQDPNCPIGGARLAFASAEAAFKGAGCPEKLKVMVAEGVGHKVTPEQNAAALEWFTTWLK